MVVVRAVNTDVTVHLHTCHRISVAQDKGCRPPPYSMQIDPASGCWYTSVPADLAVQALSASDKYCTAVMDIRLLQ